MVSIFKPNIWFPNLALAIIRFQDQIPHPIRKPNYWFLKKTPKFFGPYHFYMCKKDYY